MLQDLDDRVEGLVEDVDLASLWRTTQQPVSAADLAQRTWPDRGDLHELAALRALRRDNVYFRERKRGWEPRSAETVERLEAEERARLEQTRRRAAFIRDVVAILEAPVDEVAGRVDEAMNRAEFREFIDALQDYAIIGEHAEGRARLDRLLDDLEDALGHKLRGAEHMRAFWLNVKLGLFREHEDLGVHRFQRDRGVVAADAAARAVASASTSWTPQEWRRDFTDVWTCTIDDPASRDLDDAVSIEPAPGGGWLLGVHIADPDEWVKPGDLLDEYARFAGTSLYLPTGVVPMFPEAVSEGCMSLVEAATRPAVSTVFRFSSSLAIESVEVVASQISVDRRLSYDEVDAVLHGAPLPDLPLDSIHALRFIADEFHARRHEDGAVDIALPETRLEVSFEGGAPTGRVRIFEDSLSRALIGELMIAANVAVAAHCIERDLPVPFRSQEPPDGDLYDDEIMNVPPGYAREVSRLKRMNKGLVGTEPLRHAGLGVPHYVQSTSPIRRYTDLVVQRQLKADLAGEPLPYTAGELEQLLFEIERSVADARNVEQASNEYWMVWLLGQARGPVEAEVVDIRSSTRASVILTDYGYRAMCEVKGEVELGDHIGVEVIRADPRNRLLSLREARTG